MKFFRIRNHPTWSGTVPGKYQLAKRLLVRLEKLTPANNGIQPLRIKGAVERAQRFTSLFAGQERGAQSRPNPETSNPRESSTCLRVGAQGPQDIFRALRAASPWRLEPASCNDRCPWRSHPSLPAAATPSRRRPIPLPASTQETPESRAGCAPAEHWIG